MGNNNSNCPELDIEEEPLVKRPGYWEQYNAMRFSGNPNEITVFRDTCKTSDSSIWKHSSPLELNIKHLSVYRHPSIVKFLSVWHSECILHLAVERVLPLQKVLSSQSHFDVTLGLRAILEAIHFLHTVGHASHNNISSIAIYVSAPFVGNHWRLAGFEFLCKFSELTLKYIQCTRTHRHQSAIDPHEDDLITTNRKHLIDAYAYSSLVREVLQDQSNELDAEISDFREKCQCLQAANIENRPSLYGLLEEKYFQRDFLLIQRFLQELSLKTNTEKATFFTGLITRLAHLPGDFIGRQLSGLLLSRLVLLDETAQKELIPILLQPKTENREGLLELSIFQEYLVPELLQVFTVHDIQIRLILLKYFDQFVEAFNRHDLETVILPELLVGIKDTNDVLVANTLHTLGDLVPFLGAATIIGGKRGKLFNDGRPIEIQHSSSINVENLPERQRPDGEEVLMCNNISNQLISTAIIDKSNDDKDSIVSWNNWDGENESLDVENQELVTEKESDKTDPPTEEIDYFHGMEPVITTVQRYDVVEKPNVSSSLLAMNHNCDNSIDDDVNSNWFNNWED